MTFPAAGRFRGTGPGKNWTALAAESEAKAVPFMRRSFAKLRRPALAQGGREMVRIIATAILVSLIGLGSAVAQSSCATKAVSKDGKPLAGAARTSSIKKCCEDSALSADGKKLSGAAKASFVKKCQTDAG